MLPIHPEDQALLGVNSEGNSYTDWAWLAYSQHQKVFSAIVRLIRTCSTILITILVKKTLEEATTNKSILVDTFNHWGVPLESSKLEGPATSLTFLEIEVDTKALKIRLTSDKLDWLKDQLAVAVSKWYLTKHNLQSLTGLLQHATKVVQLGRRLLHCLTLCITKYRFSAYSTYPAESM